jgi:hypothetical protein
VGENTCCSRVGRKTRSSVEALEEIRPREEIIAPRQLGRTWTGRQATRGATCRFRAFEDEKTRSSSFVGLDGEGSESVGPSRTPGE